MKIREIVTEMKCWPGHRQVGTQPGTGKNAGKRVPDCEKIKKEESMVCHNDKCVYYKNENCREDPTCICAKKV